MRLLSYHPCREGQFDPERVDIAGKNFHSLHPRPPLFLIRLGKTGAGCPR